MDTKQCKSGPNRPTVTVRETGLALRQGQSKKLAEICRKVQALPPIEAIAADHEIPADLKADVAAELKKARQLIDEKITDIMSRFPAGKQNRLFGFKYGSVDGIKRMAMNVAFKLLGIAHDRIKMRLIAELDYYGNASGGEGNKAKSPSVE